MICREDMLELTRRMTPERTCFDRVAGAYMTEDGEIDDTFNIHFLKLSGSEMKRNLELAKAIPFSRTNDQLKEYKIPERLKEKDSIFQLLDAIRACGLKNDALMEVLYEQIADGFPADFEYAVFVFHGVYDIPVKAKDREWLEGSEEIYDFLICTVSPMKAEYEPDKPVFGFLYPAFSDRSSDDGRIDIFNADTGSLAEGLMYKLTGQR
ncbi:MAG: DUF4317 domain-containing protein [Lachnospiraceae bacterium]|nr:DUF4317 domain-containing protein [Lachnospiraceae bacterium]